MTSFHTSSQTFCDPNFEPAVMLGPGSLGFLADFVSRHTASVDATLTIIQVCLDCEDQSMSICAI